MSDTYVLGLCGAAGAGKDSVAEFLVKHHGYERVAFADAVRDAAYKLNPIIPVGELLGVQVHSPLQAIVDEHGWDYAKRHYDEIRRILQVTGSEVGRDILGKDVWINIAKSKIDSARSAGRSVVVTDVRFDNEADYIRSVGGNVWEVVRENNPDAIVSNHQSEAGVNSDGLLFNDGTLDDLRSYVERLAKTPYIEGDVRG